MSEKTYRNINIEQLPKSRVKISGEIVEAVFEKARKNALERIKLATEIPGFRVGKAPETLVVRHVGDMKILEMAAESAVEDVYGKILDEHDIRAIGLPSVSITKIAVGNPLGFVIETAVMPKILLADYRKISKEAEAKIPDPPTLIEEKEIDSVIEDLRKRVAMENNTDVASFREKTRENLIEHKKRETREKRRGAIADKLIAEAKFEIPELIVESELDTMISQFKADIERNGLTFVDYLTSLKKKEEDIRKEWRDNAERRARLELILKHIAQTENISPAEEEIKKEVDHILAHHKTADRFRVRMYVENMMKNQMVLEFLES